MIYDTYQSHMKETTNTSGLEGWTTCDDFSSRIVQFLKNKKTTHQDLKKMLRYLIEDVTLQKLDGKVKCSVRFRGGRTEILMATLPKRHWEVRKISSEWEQEIDKLLDTYAPSQIATILKERGWETSLGTLPSSRVIARVIKSRRLTPRIERLKSKGYIFPKELADKLGISHSTVRTWIKKKLVPTAQFYARGDVMVLDPSPNLPKFVSHVWVPHFPDLGLYSH